MNDNSYTAKSIEVLTGLEPVRRRPGMYTDTSRPHHLAMEIIDNSVDEAISGFANKIEVILHEDESLTVIDNGRGMPVDIHPGEKLSGAEVIMTKLHAGGKFSNKTYQYSGGLHGVGVSVVNALSRQLELQIKRDGKLHHISFKNGNKNSPLKVIDKIPKSETGTTIRFWPDPTFFDSIKFSKDKLKSLLRAKTVLCPGLTIKFLDEKTNEQETWCYKDGLSVYLKSMINEDTIPAVPFDGNYKSENEMVEWAVCWLTDPPPHSYRKLC